MLRLPVQRSIEVGLVYVAGGFAYQYRVHNSRSHPHWGYWVDTAGLVLDGVRYAAARAAGPDKDGVSAINKN
jgi:hypothetical protein